MAARFDIWESYFYPPPDDRTLRNLFDERDPQVLARLEYVETTERQRELMAGEVAIAQTYDAAHVRAIHRHLFQDVYEWAGQYRTVNMAKGVGRGFADVTTGEIDRYLA
ncbi:MAG TPA: cell filamentation protein Fic, partial [Actinotalea caeni]|nr:cell filamentation protein Fic [Actinotalea caeni]